MSIGISILFHHRGVLYSEWDLDDEEEIHACCDSHMPEAKVGGFFFCQEVRAVTVDDEFFDSLLLNIAQRLLGLTLHHLNVLWGVGPLLSHLLILLRWSLLCLNLWLRMTLELIHM